MDLQPTHKAVLVDLLVFGDNQAGNIASRTGNHRNTLTTQIRELERHDFVRNKGNGVIELRAPGRDRARELIMQGQLPY